MSLRFGLLWPFRNPDFARVAWKDLYREHLDLIVDSEGMGYDNVWLTEHHFVDDGYSPSLLPIASAIAARTTVIRIGTFLVLLPLHNPVRIAEDTATVDLISQGRFDLGLGLGFRRKEFDDQGILYSERGGRLKEGVEIIQKLLNNEVVTYSGKYNHLKEIQIVSPCVQQPHVPIWIGARTPKAIERAAKMDCHFQAGGPPALVEHYDACLEAAGRNPQDYFAAQLHWMHLAPNREQAWETAAKALHYTISKYAEWFSEADDKIVDSRAIDAIPSVDEIIRAQKFNISGEDAMVGTPADVREMIADYIARGRVTHLVLGMALSGLATAHIRNSMKLFATEVMPHFRK
ncbi:MAG: alkanesulfonate monooxygenase SsuD [Gammaproteobacteria bacterium]|jgi:alkanesulfonate monooxygenase SsuD/methylene tetrahydromethanopterin reductase-like flavin-dependent oxidoreductase (luciferase family)